MSGRSAVFAALGALIASIGVVMLSFQLVRLERRVQHLENLQHLKVIPFDDSSRQFGIERRSE